MRRCFAGSVSRRALAALPLSRWQSDATTPAEEAEKKEATSPSEFEKLKKAVDDNKKAVDGIKKEILYAAATAENARKEYRQVAADRKLEAESAFAKELLQSADALEKVCCTIATYRTDKQDIPPKTASLLNGVDLSFKVILKVLSRYQVTKMETKVGDAFDATRHVTIFTAPSTAEIGEGRITEIVKSGYERKGGILRQAEVGVAEKAEK